MMKKVYVCAPLGGDVESNLKKVRAFYKGHDRHPGQGH